MDKLLVNLERKRVTKFKFAGNIIRYVDADFTVKGQGDEACLRAFTSAN